MYSILLNFIYRGQLFYNRIVGVFVNYRYTEKVNPTISEDTLIEYNNSRIRGPKEIICYAPFKHMYFGFNGGARACCINKSDVYGNISQMNVSQLWKTEAVHQLRDKISNYNLSQGCDYCNRQLSSKNFNAFEGRMYDSILPEKTPAYPSEMTFEISNTCNLECVMCNGTYSSSIRKNRDKLPPLEEAYNEHFLDSVKDALPHLKVARFIGGEPFLIPQYYDIIEYLIEHNRSCRIYIQTNGSILNNRVKNIIENSNIRLSISIDSLQKETYEYIRKNASFNKLMEHMEYFKARTKKYHQTININFCVMTMNWREVPEMVSYCNENGFSLTLIPVESPQHFNIRYYSKEILEEILAHYTKFEEALLTQNRFNGEKFSDLINFVRFCLEKTTSKLYRIEILRKKTSEELSPLSEAFFTKEKLDAADAAFVLNLVSDCVETLGENDKRLFLATFIAHMEEYHVAMVKDYCNGPEWRAEFEIYFKNIKNHCFDSAAYNMDTVKL